MKPNKKIKCGLLLRFGSFWVGTHWSPEFRRMCFNPVPFFTIWVAHSEGKGPKPSDNDIWRSNNSKNDNAK